MGGRPFGRGFERRVHRRRSQSRCHRTTVSGCTRTTAVRQFRQIRAKAIQNSVVGDRVVRNGRRLAVAGAAKRKCKGRSECESKDDPDGS